MAARRPLVRFGGKNRQIPADDNLVGYARYYEGLNEPSGTRVAGDIWFKTDTNVEYRWYVSSTAGGGWLSDAGVSADNLSSMSYTKKVSATIGDGTAKTFTFNHNLGTQDIVVSVRELSTNEGVLTDWVASGVNTVALSFGTAPTSNQYRVTVLG